MRPDVKPTVGAAKLGAGERDRYTHDAFGTITMTKVTGRGKTLFGSDIEHSERIRISVQRAHLDRDLSRDWIFGNNWPLVEFEMSHAQFAQFITSVGNGTGTPVTLTMAPTDRKHTEPMPGIVKSESKLDLFRHEIKQSVSEGIASLKESIGKIGEMLDGGSVSKKELRSLHHSLKCSLDNLPGNVSFVVRQAEEALEKATADAKIEVEAYIATNIERAGVKTIQSAGDTIGALQTDPCPTCAPGTVCRSPSCGRLKMKGS